MAQSIDELQIEINAQAGKANDAIDRLINRIDKLTTSIGHLDGSNLVSLANGVQRLGTAMQTMNNVKTADFSRLARNLQNLNNIDVSKLSNLSANVRHIATAFNGLSGMDKSAEQISLLANGIKQLGYKSADKAIANIPQLATAMKKLMAELSTAPKVSQNIIDMTNALAKFARTGASGGKAANSLVNSFNRVSKASIGMKFNMFGAVSGITSLSRSLLSAAGIAGGFYAVIRGIKESIDISSDLTEVQNVVDVTFGNFKQKIEDLAKVSIPELGMSELTVKQIGSRFQAMGVAMGISQKGMADMSTELTRLAGDMASFYNVEQKAVGEDLESIFTGQTKPLRQYGLDLTEATLQEWAMKQGMDANINSMSQMGKTMLRYQYVMANTGAAQGDFLRTQDTWANQVRILKENFRELASVIGSSFINALKPLVSALNNAMSHIIAFAKVVSNALGKIFGWKYEDTSGGIANDYSEAADSVGDLADGTGKAANNAKKLKQQLQGIDELNVLSSNKDTGTGGGSGGGGGASGGADDSGGQWVKTDSILKDYESQLDTLYKLGEHIGETLTNAMKSIDWDNVYQGAKNFGSGLASFLNGLISPELFGEVGKTIAGSLNTALYALNSFGKTFDWKDFGNSIASGINNFFSTFDFRNLADTINVWVDGIKTTIVTTIKNIKWSDIIKGAFDFVGGLEFDTIAIAVGAFLFTHGGKELTASLLNGLLKDKLGIDNTEKFLGSVSTKIGVALIVALESYKVGNWLYENVDSIQKFSDGVAGWILKDGEEIAIAKTISVTLSGLAIALPIASIAGSAIAAAKAGTLGTALYVWATDTFIPALSTFFTKTLPAMLPALTVAAKVGLAIAVAVGGFKLGNYIYEKVPTVQECSDALVELVGGLFTGEISLGELTKATFDLSLDFIAKGLQLFNKDGQPFTGEDIKNFINERLGDFRQNSLDIFFRIKGSIGKTANKIIGIVKEFNDKSLKEKIEFAIGLVPDGFQTVTGWITKVVWGDDSANKPIGLIQSGFETVAGWITKVVWGDKIVNKDVGLKASFEKGFKTVASWLKGLYWGVNLNKPIGLTKNFGKGIKTVAGWVMQYIGGTVSVGVSLFKSGWTSIKSFFGLSNGGIVTANGGVKLFADGGVIDARKIKKFGNGIQNGLPNHGTAFIAGESGPEIVGHVGGRTEVLNQSQLASTMYSAVLSAMNDSNKNNQPIQVYLDGKVVFDSTRQYAREYTNRTGKPAYI